MFPFAVALNVKLLPPELLPVIKVTPEEMVKVPVTVSIFPEDEAWNVQFLLIVRLFKDIVGTPVMIPFVPEGMVTSSPVPGAPLGFQFAAVVQVPPAAGTHVFVAAIAIVPDNKIIIIIRVKHLTVFNCNVCTNEMEGSIGKWVFIFLVPYICLS
jgi:hypothetical protein